jgi:hypothetical protein
MLKAVLSKGILQYRWVPNGEGLYDDDRIVGDPLYTDGQIEESVWVDLLPGDILQVNQATKDSILEARALVKSQRDAIELEKINLIKELKQLYQDIIDATTQAQLKAILKKIVRLMGLIYAE